jgi:hypothetical protein
MSTRGLLKKESPPAMAFMFFKHPPTEARIKAKPSLASHSFYERQLESGFGGWVDEKIKQARAAHPHVFSGYLSVQYDSRKTFQQKKFSYTTFDNNSRKSKRYLKGTH